MAMAIRKTEMSDLAAVMQIYADAQAFMRENGNPTQWGDVHPTREMVARDISAGTGYVCEDNGAIAAAFYFNVEREPTYEKIDGAWLNDEPCGVVHRIAKRSGAAKGVGAFCIDWCFGQCRNIKIDTHKDNVPMRKLLARLGFSYCGIIWVQNGDERMAFQKAL